MYKFYIRILEKTFDPYTAKQILNLHLLNDVLVTEENMGVWEPYYKFNFLELTKREEIYRLQNAPSHTKKEEYSKDPTSKPITYMFPREIEYKANFSTGLYSIGGKIIITPELLIFRAHSFNPLPKCVLSDRIFNIKEITGYKKGILSFLHVFFYGGHSIKLVVYKKQEIIYELEARRIQMMY